jgi:hypothetical protein
VIGFLKDRTGTHTIAFILIPGLGLIAAFLALQLRSTEALRSPVSRDPAPIN